MDLEGAFLDSEGALLHSLPKSGEGPWPLSPPGSYVPVEQTLIVSLISLWLGINIKRS